MLKGGQLSQRGIVLNIQRFTTHDGPGIRTEFFLKGCPLRCDWCGNPESFKTNIELGIYASKCISKEKCGECEKVCSIKNEQDFTDGKRTSVDRKHCVICLKCQKACPSEAMKQWGWEMSVEECIKEILKDKGYFDRSGGGVTISGGEPLLQSNFVADIFKSCKANEIHTCCETSLYVDWNDVENILPYTDLIISDIKHMDSLIHKKYTGVDNNKIFENLKNVVKKRVELILRIPVIPGINDNMVNMEFTADFILKELNGKVRTLQLLSFMRLGEEKYESLGMPYKMKNLKFDRELFQKQVQEFAKYFNNRGIHCLVGTKEK